MSAWQPYVFLFAVVRSTRAHLLCWVTCSSTKLDRRSPLSTRSSTWFVPSWRHRTLRGRLVEMLCGRLFTPLLTSLHPNNVFSVSSMSWSPSSSGRTTNRIASLTQPGRWRTSARQERLTRRSWMSSLAAMSSYICAGCCVRSFLVCTRSAQSSSMSVVCSLQSSTRYHALANCSVVGWAIIVLSKDRTIPITASHYRFLCSSIVQCVWLCVCFICSKSLSF